jgi:hypothetical protein
LAAAYFSLGIGLEDGETLMALLLHMLLSLWSWPFLFEHAQTLFFRFGTISSRADAKGFPEDGYRTECCAIHVMFRAVSPRHIEEAMRLLSKYCLEHQCRDLAMDASLTYLASKRTISVFLVFMVEELLQHTEVDNKFAMRRIKNFLLLSGSL